MTCHVCASKTCIEDHFIVKKEEVKIFNFVEKHTNKKEPFSIFVVISKLFQKGN